MRPHARDARSWDTSRGPTLFVSTSVHDLRLLLPAEKRFRHFSDEARVVVSEPLIDLPGLWHEVPPSTALVVRDGPDSEDLPFVPCVR